MPSEIQGHVGCLIAYKVLGKCQGSQFQSEVQSFLRNNGVEWTCKRYKAIYTASHHLRNGDRDAAVRIYQKNSISYHKKTCLPKGVIGSVVRRYLAAQRSSVIRRYECVLRYYTSLCVQGEPSVNQSKKAVANIISPSQNQYSSKEMEEILSSFKKRWENLSTEEQKELVKYDPHEDRLHWNSYYFSGLDLSEARATGLSSKPLYPMVLSALTEAWIPKSLQGYYGNTDPVQFVQCYDYNADSGYAGRILGMQQNGCKLRVVAQPTLRIQKAFRHLHTALQRVYRTLYSKESCVEDQVRGAYAARDQLNRRGNLFSVDLSSATDRFPRVFSEMLMDQIGLHLYSEALEEVCDRPWLNANLIGPDTLKYSTGQPMGLYGSFPLFQLSNLAIADYSVQKAIDSDEFGGLSLDSFPDGTYFKVLGDDIIISDPVVAQTYSSVMEKLGVDISLDKSYSGSIAEFAGFIVVPSRDGYTAFKPYKHPTGSWIVNPLEFVHALGVSVKNQNFSERSMRRWETIFDCYSATIQHRTIDLNPILTESEPSNPIKDTRQWLWSLCTQLQSLLLDKEIGDQDEYAKGILRSVTQWDNPFGDGNLISSLLPIVEPFHDRNRLGDLSFTPELAAGYDKARKDAKRNRAVRNFWKDPLNSQWRYWYDHPEVRTNNVKDLLSYYEVEKRLIKLEKSLDPNPQLPERSGPDLAR